MLGEGGEGGDIGRFLLICVLVFISPLDRESKRNWDWDVEAVNKADIIFGKLDSPIRQLFHTHNINIYCKKIFLIQTVSKLLLYLFISTTLR